MRDAPDFKPIKIKVLDSLLLYMTIGAFPLLLTSILVYYDTGWTISTFPVLFGLLSVPLVYFNRNRLNYLFKFAYLLITSYIAAILILHDFNFIGTGMIILIAITLISSLFFGLRTGWIFMAINIVFIAAFSISYQFNLFNYNFNYTKFIKSPYIWIDNIAAFLFFVGIVVIASGQIHQALVNRLMKSSVEKEKFENIFNNIQDSIMIYSYDGKILEVNNSLLKMYGISRNSALEINAHKFFELRKNEIDLYEIGNCSRRYYETKAKRFNDNKPFDIEVMFSPIQYGDQKAVLSNIRDISHRKAVEESLRKSEEKYRNLIDSSPAGIFIIEGEQLLYVNPWGARNLGYKSSGELVGKSIFKLIAPEYKKIIIPRLEMARKKIIDQPTQIKLFKKDGKEMWLEMLSLPFEYYGSSAILVMGFDITERKKAEALILQKNKEIERQNLEYALLNQKLQKAKEKAEESDRLKSAFLSNMSHEIRTPMNAILGFSDLLIKTKIPEDKRMEYIGIINSSGNQLLSLINDIIDISKIESNQIVIDSSTQMNISEIFKHLSVLFQAKAKKNKIQLSFDVELTEKQTIFYLDEIRLKQILVNLIGNAIKFTQSGFVRYNVLLENNELMFSVEDSGIGIDPSVQNIIFDRFRQADGSTTRDFGGTGLGLAISKALVELMGGKIWLTSALGKGTTFYFTMPFRPAASENETTDYVDENNTDKSIWKNKHILLVEDEEANILFLTELLQPSGLKVSVARNAEEAYSLMEKERNIRLVLMDIKIPKVDGYQITRQIKKDHPGTIVIAQTAYALAEERTRIMNSGFDDYLSKPIGKNLLFNILSKYLNNGNV